MPPPPVPRITPICLRVSRSSSLGGNPASAIASRAARTASGTVRLTTFRFFSSIARVRSSPRIDPAIRLPIPEVSNSWTAVTPLRPSRSDSR